MSHVQRTERACGARGPFSGVHFTLGAWRLSDATPLPLLNPQHKLWRWLRELEWSGQHMVGVVREMDNEGGEMVELGHQRMCIAPCHVCCALWTWMDKNDEGFVSIPKLRNVWRTRCNRAPVLFRVSATNRGDFGHNMAPSNVPNNTFLSYHCSISFLFVRATCKFISLIFFIKIYDASLHGQKNALIPDCLALTHTKTSIAHQTEQTAGHHSARTIGLSVCTPHLNAYTNPQLLNRKERAREKKCVLHKIYIIIILFYLHFKWLWKHGLPRQTLYHVEREAQ